MSDTTLRWIIATVIALLLIHEVGSVIAALFGGLWGVLSVIVVIAVSLFSARLAKSGGRSSFWFLMPTMLFTVLPTIYVIWSAMNQETTTVGFLTRLAPFLIGFVTPVVLLLCVYYSLRNRSIYPRGHPVRQQ